MVGLPGDLPYLRLSQEVCYQGADEPAVVRLLQARICAAAHAGNAACRLQRMTIESMRARSAQRKLVSACMRPAHTSSATQQDQVQDKRLAAAFLSRFNTLKLITMNDSEDVSICHGTRDLTLSFEFLQSAVVPHRQQL